MTRSQLAAAGAVTAFIGDGMEVGTTFLVVMVGLQAVSAGSVLCIDANYDRTEATPSTDTKCRSTLGALATGDAPTMGRALTDAVHVDPSGVHILALADEFPVDVATDIDALRLVILAAASLYDHVLVDLGHRLDATRRQALSAAHQHVVVTTPWRAWLGTTRRLCDGLVERGVSAESVHLVLNRVNVLGASHLAPTSEHLGSPVVAVLPEDPLSATYLWDAGFAASSVPPRHTLQAGLVDLADWLTGRGA